MKQYYLEGLSKQEIADLMIRPSESYADIGASVKYIVGEVAARGDAALRQFTEKYDKCIIKDFLVSEVERTSAVNNVSAELRDAIVTASRNIEAFHRAQLPLRFDIETMPGVVCSREWRPIKTVGLYIPGGTAPLVSTLLMLAIPAKLAGCTEIVICSPPLPTGQLSPSILYAANMLGIEKIFRVGGAQAIAAMASGTETVPKVDKIFGPGNRFVAAAKLVITQPPYNVAIDVHAGPTEVLVIADENANPAWVAADLIAQAEHGEDSQVILIATSPAITAAIESEIEKQEVNLWRRDKISKALEKSYSLIVGNIDQGIQFSNQYAPEHLQMAVENPEQYIGKIESAGSVFMGAMTSAVFGDYASGTNHTLPTSGAARYAGGVTTESFMKPISFQKVSDRGFRNISAAVATLADAESLDGHANAVLIRTTNDD
jgi:histidinol dehydrogenase